MFDLPNAKRVRRHELYSPSPSRATSPDPALGQAFLHSLAGAFTETFPATAHVAEEPQSASEEVEFRLFANSSKEKTPARIRIQSPHHDNEPAGLTISERPRAYYFRDSLSPAQQYRLEIAAVSGEHVLVRSHTKWPGCSLPWRVTTIGSTGIPLQVQTSSLDKAKRKTRKSKKSRIAIRKKAIGARERKAEAEEATAAKELAERAKRAKRNREKKLKKRERDKLKKTAAQAAGEDLPANSDDSGSG
ncbi:hypothetical protein FKW77_000098 [Venturia effusa]|uniref:Uncharacterized protein n=1 Tax=Venturia effusa TaxID=50376 RepID=A0A517LM13_9PEZI|nr:hypothetical protein FKW77_000098 [Venturia effusa]